MEKRDRDKLNRGESSSPEDVNRSTSNDRGESDSEAGFGSKSGRPEDLKEPGNEDRSDLDETDPIPRKGYDSGSSNRSEH